MNTTTVATGLVRSTPYALDETREVLGTVPVAGRELVLRKVQDLAPPLPAKCVLGRFFGKGRETTRHVQVSVEQLVFELEKCPAEERPALKSAVQALLARAKFDMSPPAYTIPGYRAAALKAAFAGERFRFSDKLSGYSLPPADAPRSRALDIAIAEIDFTMKKYQGPEPDAIQWGRTLVSDFGTALCVAVHFEKAGHRVSITDRFSGPATRYSVAVYEDGKDPGRDLHGRAP